MFFFHLFVFFFLKKKKLKMLRKLVLLIIYSRSSSISSSFSAFSDHTTPLISASLATFALESRPAVSTRTKFLFGVGEFGLAMVMVRMRKGKGMIKRRKIVVFLYIIYLVI